MTHDIDIIKKFYTSLPQRVSEARKKCGRPLTLVEKILYAHLADASFVETSPQRGESYLQFSPDRVAMQDATAQMAVLQFMNAGRKSSAVPTTIHCDHLITAHRGASIDLQHAEDTNAQVYAFLQSAATRYGFGFWEPGSGIIHQVLLENYAFPGGLMIGTDSHTPNAGGLGMLAIGVGGADAVDVMSGMPWELKLPKLIGVHLHGKLRAWATPKDVILHLAGLLTVKGGTNAAIEYFGEGAASLSCTGKATICNMGAEVGATSSVFAYDDAMHRYLEATGRADVAELACTCASHLRADDEVMKHPMDYYDRVIDINLDEIEPHVNGPFTPDAAYPVSQMKERVQQEQYPEKIDVILIGSCTNSSYEDLSLAAQVVQHALSQGLQPQTQLIVNPGSEQIRVTAERDGILSTFEQAGAVIMANACGPCIGQWKRITDDPLKRGSIITTFNRNFAKRADGNPNTHAFITSPALAAAYVFVGSFMKNPCELLPAPKGIELPEKGFQTTTTHQVVSSANENAEVIIPENSDRLQRLQPFAPFSIGHYQNIPLLIKTKGKCTTDHISPAGAWLRYRGHLEQISRNLLSGATNAFSEKCGTTLCSIDKKETTVAEAAQKYRDAVGGSFIVAEENYGEGSSREHAAMEPRFLGVRFVLAKSFARIHETNLKKQGVLALTFEHPSDYQKIAEGDTACVCGIEDFTPESSIDIIITHATGDTERIKALHTYNATQIEWFKHGSALNAMRATMGN